MMSHARLAERDGVRPGRSAEQFQSGGAGEDLDEVSLQFDLPVQLLQQVGCTRSSSSARTEGRECGHARGGLRHHCFDPREPRAWAAGAVDPRLWRIYCPTRTVSHRVSVEHGRMGVEH